MVKYPGTEYRVERKEYHAMNRREPGSSAASPGGEGDGKVRPGARFAFE